MVNETSPSDRYVYPPRGLDREAAARYLGVSPSVFDDLMTLQKLSKPRRLGPSLIWDRHELDAAFDLLPVDTVPPICGTAPAQEAKPHPSVYTPETLAHRWKCSATHVRNMITRGHLPAFKMGGKLLRIKVSDVVAYEAAQSD